MRICRVFKLNYLILAGVLSAFSCGKSENFESISYANFDKKVTIADCENSGNVILPNDIEMRYTIPYLQQNKLDYFGKKYVFNPRDYNDSKIKMLVLPIHFADGYVDSTDTKNNTREIIDEIFKGNRKSTGRESVQSFYKKTSYGLIDFDITVANFYSTSKKSNEVTNAFETVNLINEALDNLKVGTESKTFKDFDGNNDGLLDALWVLYDLPATDEIAENNGNLRPYTFSLGGSGYANPHNISSFSWGSIDFFKNGSKNEITYDAHTFIHETGHLFGLNDYYDYSVKTSPMSGVNMMDYNVCDLDMYSKLILGWVTPVVIYGDAKVNKKLLTEEHHPIVIVKDEGTLFKNGNKYIFNPFSEYLMFDYYDFDEEYLNYHDMVYGYDKINLKETSAIKKSGLKLYHVNNNLIEVNLKDRNNWSYFDSVSLKNDKNMLARIFSNSTGKHEVHAEPYLLGSMNISNIPDNIDKENEVTLIAKKSELENIYESLYVKKELEGSTYKTSLMKLSDDICFDDGDAIDINYYSNYFLNGSKDGKIVANRESTFSGKIELFA